MIYMISHSNKAIHLEWPMEAQVLLYLLNLEGEDLHCIKVSGIIRHRSICETLGAYSHCNTETNPGQNSITNPRISWPIS